MPMLIPNVILQKLTESKKKRVHDSAVDAIWLV